MVDNASSIGQLEKTVHREFDFAIDYLWKSPTLLGTLEEEEQEKLARYFRDDPSRASLRWSFESYKLFGLFPELLANGNLLAACSLFEVHVRALCALLAGEARNTRLDTAGQGISRLLSHIRGTGIPTNELELWPQVDAALKVRNCLAHLGGAVDQSGQETEIRRIASSRTYLSREHRASSNRKHIDEQYRVSLEESESGSRVSISPLYPWLACAYLRDYLLSLIDVVREADVGERAV